MAVPNSAELRAELSDGLQDSEIREGLARVLTSPTFRDSLQLTHFLTFVVEATLSGNASCIKAYTIAVEALGRDYDFDPERDPIVRVEAGRLRQALTRYYSNSGRDDPLLITLPRGAYIPFFARRTGRPQSLQSVHAGTFTPLDKQLRGAGNILDLAEAVLDGIIRLHKSDFGSVQLYDEQSSELIMVAHRGFRADMLRPFARIDVAPDLYISARAAHSRQPVVIDDAFADDQFPFLKASATVTGYRAVQASPMITSEDRLVGVVATHFAESEASTRIDLQMTQLYTRLAANVLVQLLPPPGHRILIDSAA